MLPVNVIYHYRIIVGVGGETEANKDSCGLQLPLHVTHS